MTVKYNTRENYVYDGRLDLVTAALKAMDIKQGCEVYLQCDAPPGSGLGTSSTVMVAMLTAMARWKGIMLDAYAMADLAYEVEREDLKIDGGKAILDENGILTGFNEKTADPVPGTINGGIYLMKKSLLEEIPEGKVSLENEMIPKWLSEGKKLGGFVNDGYFIDIGIPEAYFQFQEDVKTGVVH